MWILLCKERNRKFYCVYENGFKIETSILLFLVGRACYWIESSIAPKLRAGKSPVAASREWHTCDYIFQQPLFFLFVHRNGRTSAGRRWAAGRKQRSVAQTLITQNKWRVSGANKYLRLSPDTNDGRGINIFSWLVGPAAQKVLPGKFVSFIIIRMQGMVRAGRQGLLSSRCFAASLNKFRQMPRISPSLRKSWGRIWPEIVPSIFFSRKLIAESGTKTLKNSHQLYEFLYIF